MALLWTATADVRNRWIGGDPLTATDPQIETLLEDAEDTVIREFSDMAARVTSETVPLRRVVKVVARMVIRHLRNPEGVRQVQEGAGPFQRSKTLGGEEPGALYLTDEDRAELGGHARGGAFTIDTTPPLDTVGPAPYAWIGDSNGYPLDNP